MVPFPEEEMLEAPKVNGTSNPIREREAKPTGRRCQEEVEVGSRPRMALEGASQPVMGEPPEKEPGFSGHVSLPFQNSGG